MKFAQFSAVFVAQSANTFVAQSSTIVSTIVITIASYVLKVTIIPTETKAATQSFKTPPNWRTKVVL